MYICPHKKAIPPYLCRQVAKSQLKPPFGCDLPRWLRMANYLENQKSVYWGNYIPCIAVLVSCNCSFIAAKVGRKNGTYKFFSRKFEEKPRIFAKFPCFGNVQLSNFIIYAVLKKYS